MINHTGNRPQDFFALIRILYSLVEGMTLSCVIIRAATGVLVSIGTVTVLGAVVAALVGVLVHLLTARHRSR